MKIQGVILGAAIALAVAACRRWKLYQFGLPVTRNSIYVVLRIRGDARAA
jgi:hypothetical protein